MLFAQQFSFVLFFEMIFCKSPPKSSVKSYTLSLQTAWTSFDPHLYSGGSSSAGTALVESSNCKVSFILNRGIVTEATPWSQDGVQCIPLYQSCCQPGQCPADGLTGLWGLTVALVPVCHPGTPTASGTVTDQGWLA